jgi:uncharacterized protein YukE
MTELGANTEQLRNAASLFKSSGEKLRSSTSALSDCLARTAWQGQDSIAFSEVWSSKHKGSLESIAAELQSLAVELAKQAQQQEDTSASFSPSERFATPRPFVVNSVESSVGTKSGAIVAGKDGSKISKSALSDGRIQVSVDISTGTSVDLGDALQVAKWAKGDFFSEAGLEISADFDAAYERAGSVTYTLSDQESADIFYARLEERQHKLANRIVGGGLSFYDLGDVIRDLPELEGSVEWEKYQTPNYLMVSGSVSAGNEFVGATGSISDLKKFVAETKSSDGTTGRLSTISGTGSISGEIKLDQVYSFDGGGEGSFSRSIHLVKDANGDPIRLEIEREYTGAVSTTFGGTFLGTGSTGSYSEGSKVSNKLEFDLTDPITRNSLLAGGETDGALLGSSEKFRSMGSEQVTVDHVGERSAEWSFLLSGKGEETSADSSNSSASFRASGSSVWQSQK